MGDINAKLIGSNVQVPISNKRLNASLPNQILIPTYDGSNQPVHPSVVYIPKGFGPSGEKYKYWMAYTPFPNGNSDYENPCIVASNDGVNWVIPSGLVNPVVPAPADLVNFFNRDPELIYDGTQLILYWSTSDRRDSSAITYRKTSSNGVAWSASVACNKGFGSFCIARKSSTDWLLWAATDNPRLLRRYKSMDGITWNDDGYSRTNIDGATWHPSVLVEPNGYHFIVSPWKRGGSSEFMPIYYGFSPDGGDILFDTEPIFIPEFSGWLSGNVYRSSLVRGSNQTYNLYISGWDKDANQWHIGMTTATITSNINRLIGKSPYDKKVITLADAVQVRDTTNHFINYGALNPSNIPIEEWNSFENRALEIVNSHDQPVVVQLFSDARGMGLYDGLLKGSAQTVQRVTIPASGTYKPTLIDYTDIPALKGMTTGAIGVGVSSSTAPTTGALTVKLVMWN